MKTHFNLNTNTNAFPIKCYHNSSMPTLLPPCWPSAFKSSEISKRRASKSRWESAVVAGHFQPKGATRAKKSSDTTATAAAKSGTSG